MPCMTTFHQHGGFVRTKSTHEWKSTVVAGSYLWLIRIDVDSWVSRRATAAFTSNHAIVSPSYGLSMDELDSSLGLGLYRKIKTVNQ